MWLLAGRIGRLWYCDVVDASVREHILAIDYAVTPEQLQAAYQNARRCIADAVIADPEPEDHALINDNKGCFLR